MFTGKYPTFPPLSFTNNIAGFIKSIDNRHLVLYVSGTHGDIETADYLAIQ